MKKISDDQLIKRIVEENAPLAKKTLARKYSSLVFAIAEKYRKYIEVSFEFLIGEGMLGLFKAVENVRSKDKKMSFQKFARKFIERSLCSALTDFTGEKINPPQEKHIKS